jgi:hypothetical protein
MIKRTERVELALIVAATAASAALASALPRQIALGPLLLTAFVLLLAQGLLRDLWLLAMGPSTPAPPTRAMCLCAESAIGVFGVAAGLIVTGAGIGTVIDMAPWRWALGVGTVLLAGFASKDLVIDFDPLRVRREPDHRNVVVRWRR